MAFAGGVGSLARGILGNYKGFLPWGILVANTLATAIAAWAILWQPQLGLALVAGLAGGLSTFSTFIAGTWQLIVEGHRLRAFLNIVLNLVLPSTAVALMVVCL